MDYMTDKSTDPTDYAADIDNLPDNSIIRKALAYGARFEMSGRLWIARHPLKVACGRTQVEAAEELLREKGR
jgi:hypothetical protein